MNTIQKKLIEEGGVIKELSDKLVHSEKENFELRQVVEESRADTASAEKRMADLIKSLDSTGKERGGLQNELESANKRLKDAAAQLTKSSAAAKQKDEKIETLLSSKEDVEKQLTLVAEDLAIFKERYAAGERTKAQLEAHNADLQAQLRRSKSMHETQITQLQQRLSEIDSDREGLNNEQERLLEEVVSKQEEVDQLMAQVIKLQDSDEALGDELADLIKINESMRERLEMQEELLAQSREKDLVIVEHESNLDALNSRYEKTKSKLKACEISRDEGVTQLRNRDTRIEFLEEELASTIRELQGANSARLSDQLKRLGELEMDAGRKKAAKEAAELKLEQSEAAARKTVAHLEEEISNLQNQLASERTAAEISRASGDVNAARLRQETRQLQEKIDALNACESEKAQMSQEIARLEQEMEELRSRLAELLAELSDMKRTGQATSPLEVVQVEEERQTLVYDEAADMLRGLKRVSLFNLLYSVSFAKVRDQRQWNSLTLSALSTAVRPIPTPRKRDAAYYAKKRCARVLVHLATTPAHHNIPRSGWLEQRTRVDVDSGWLARCRGRMDMGDARARRNFSRLPRTKCASNVPTRRLANRFGVDASRRVGRRYSASRSKINQRIDIWRACVFRPRRSSNCQRQRARDARGDPAHVPTRRSSRSCSRPRSVGVHPPRWSIRTAHLCATTSLRTAHVRHELSPWGFESRGIVLRRRPRGSVSQS